MSTKTKERHILTDEELEALREHLPESCYQKDAEVIYRGHVPHVGFVLLDGNMFLQKTRKQEDIAVGEVHGVRELHDNLPYRYTIKVGKGSSVLVLDRSTLQELKDSTDPKVREIISLLLKD